MILETSPEAVGKIAGGVIFGAILVAGMLKCIAVMRRPTSNRKCLLALLLLLTAWLLSAVVTLMLAVSDAPEQPTRMITSVIGALVLFAAMGVAVWGLATHDPTRFTQGRRQGIWTLVIGGLLIAYGGFVVVRTSIATRGMEATGKAGARIERSEFNFSIEPPAPWVEMKAEAVSPLACVAARRPNPETYFAVIAEHPGAGARAEAVVEVIKANLTSGADVLEQSESRVTLSAGEFVRIVSRARMHSGGLTLDYEHWVNVRNGFIWQIMVWTADSNRSKLADEARRVADTFRILDPNRTEDEKGTVADVSRPALGYSTKIAGTGWNVWPSAKTQIPLADFAAQRPSEALVVAALRFDDETPDLDAIARGWLASFDMAVPAETDRRSRPWRPCENCEGREYSLDRTVNGRSFSYVLRVSRGSGFSQFVAGWALTTGGDLALVRRGLDSVALAPPQGEPPALTAEQRGVRAKVSNAAGLSYFDRKDFAAAERWFRYAADDTPNDAVILGNVSQALENAGRREQARDFLAGHVERLPQALDLGVHFARLELETGQPDEATTTFLAIVERGLRDESALADWVNRLEGADRQADAIRVADDWVARHPSTTASRWQAHAHFEAGEHAAGIEMLQKLAAANPDDASVACDLARRYNRTGEYAKAAALADTLLSREPEDSEALLILGWSQMGRKWYRDAKATFERAARKRPNDEDVQSALREASAELGQGNNTDIKAPIDPVPMPDDVRRELEALPMPPDLGKDGPFVWLDGSTGVRFEKGKPLRRTVRRRVRVLTTDGVNEWSSIEVAFDGLVERVYPNRVEVRDADGKIVARGSVDDAYVRDADANSADDRRTMHLQVPGLQPGFSLEWDVTFEDRASSDAFPFRRHLFCGPSPMGAQAVFVVGDVSSLKAEMTHGEGTKTLRAAELAAWIVPPLPARPEEPFAVWPEYTCPLLWLGGDEGDWAAVATKYLADVRDRLVVEPEIAALASKIVEGKTTARDKIAAIVRWVQHEVGYKAIEFGARARRPNAASETVKLRYGDCKDHALLLHLLLRAAGVDSCLAAVNTTWITNPSMPTLDQFNHLVVHVPSLGEGWLVDVTDKECDPLSLPAEGLWESHALLFDSAKPRLLPPPKVPTDCCRVESRRTVTPAGADWRVEEELTLHGYLANSMRRSLAGLDADGRTDAIQSFIEDDGPARVLELGVDALDDPAKPVRLVVTYLVRNAISVTDGASSGAVPALWERDYLIPAFVKNRHTRFLRRYPNRFESEAVVKLPAAVRTTSLAALRKEGKSEFATWTLTPGELRDGGREISVRFAVTLLPGEHAAERYSAFHDACEGAAHSFDQPISWGEKP